MIFFTDGSASPNPGPGGYAVIDEKSQPVALGSNKQTTNNRMEAEAIRAALEKADGKVCKIYTDSQFWINVLTVWAVKWQANNWQKKGGEIKNLDLVKSLYDLFTKSQATLVWIKGHNNHPLNELADDFANQARKGLTMEKFYEKAIN